jgi:hypothetical protein
MATFNGLERHAVKEETYSLYKESIFQKAF